jgi:hypothetical protein
MASLAQMSKGKAPFFASGPFTCVRPSPLDGPASNRIQPVRNWVVFGLWCLSFIPDMPPVRSNPVTASRGALGEDSSYDQ